MRRTNLVTRRGPIRYFYLGEAAIPGCSRGRQRPLSWVIVLGFLQVGSGTADGVAVTIAAEHRTEMSIDEVIERRAVISVYQPIVDLDTGFTVGYEALARGPVGTPFESPERMFAAAAAVGLSSELDWVCRAAALQGALDAGLGRSRQLFVNIEPSSLRHPRPHFLAQLLEVADTELDVVMEVTERALVNDRGR